MDDGGEIGSIAQYLARPAGREAQPPERIWFYQPWLPQRHWSSPATRALAEIAPPLAMS